MQIELTLPENNRNGNDADYQLNKPHFTNQTQIVLNHLLNGETVSGRLMYELHGIQDVRARIYSIKKSLLGTEHELVETKIKGGHGAKEWRLVTKQNKAA